MWQIAFAQRSDAEHGAVLHGASRYGKACAAYAEGVVIGIGEVVADGLVPLSLALLLGMAVLHRRTGCCRYRLFVGNAVCCLQRVLRYGFCLCTVACTVVDTLLPAVIA